MQVMLGIVVFSGFFFFLAESAVRWLFWREFEMRRVFWLKFVMWEMMGTLCWLG
jgi:hypothetical protein